MYICCTYAVGEEEVHIIYLFLDYPWWYGGCLLSVEGDQTLVFLPELCAVLTHDVDWSRHQHQLRTDNTNSPTVQWGLSTTSLVRQYSALLWCCGAVVLWCSSVLSHFLVTSAQLLILIITTGLLPPLPLQVHSS